MKILEDKKSKEMIWQDGDEMYYSKGVSDPNYCVLKFTTQDGRYYSNFKSENFKLMARCTMISRYDLRLHLDPLIGGCFQGRIVVNDILAAEQIKIFAFEPEPCGQNLGTDLSSDQVEQF
jgi:hypothetical protein